ncbi:TPA: hypothetical protein DDW69_00960 [candidate division CPR2 bacterium]|uniref:Glycosyltransferase 2-like domain-containing protein n=1 Tax=candidate division CPR2 bacterium GW2011_GWC1_41_48 TaxID=1618344 RepID=A0A0G0W6T1_UNCC2|nr:MAG: hypothetical protein UT47_C0007G0006 [candidate division CPR2 bacterium GW2011_GWC2_39_35]KKR27721.1 MAG: hypothetical protein UT59_C0046G0006 [candidate division CPR2 bacterium GW2011_GWD1_39_7]KKR28753.1 MAG: hypothetical protein UT60_C0013G0020 [candidate division CPR2 bacterium GW2011_GWD2_39_7]KKS08660.1 MAG: hypothetical protein UU65_C0006G0030 [candidate division CPR2 bacterium GW2011_GWC1_41_48]OGB59787.1 MAG: hypothetical protein A2Y27_00145 [candidate division CPR2 bacterium G
MYKNKKIVVVTPAYNEANHIADVIDGLPEYIDNIVIVDDCSTDNTEEIVKKHKSKKVIYLKNGKNMGAGYSVTAAINKAKEVKADITITMAGDNQMDPKYVPSLLDALIDEGYDCAKGNRFYSKEGLKGMPRHRVWGSIILTFMTRMASGYWTIFDTQNGYYALGSKALYQIDFNSLTKGFPYENDLWINLNILGLKFKDVPIPAKYGDEVSYMKMWKIIPQFTLFLVGGFFRRIYKKYVLRGIHPIFLFFLFGSILFLWGIIFGAYAWHRSAITGDPATTGTVMISAIPFLMGFEMLLWALVLDIQEDPK